MNKAIILTTSAFSLLISTISHADMGPFEANTDRPGSDYKKMDLPLGSENQCRDYCDLDSTCKAYTFVKPGVQAEHAICYLKNSVPEAQRNQCCTSGVKLQMISVPIDQIGDSGVVIKFREPTGEWKRLSESLRLMAIHNQAYNEWQDFGTNVQRGFYVKQVGGPVVASFNSHIPFQPASTLKLAPFYAAIDLVDRKVWKSMDKEAVSWVGIKGKIKAEHDQDCETNTDGKDRVWRSAKLKDAMPTMMYNSDNPIHEALLRKMDIDTLNDIIKNAGLINTVQYYGCKYDPQQKNWADNRSTLEDLGLLYEGVISGTLLNKQKSRDFFVANLITLSSGSTYKSTIRDQEWEYNNEVFRRMVAREAKWLGKDKKVVDAFMKRVIWRSKAGGGSPNKPYSYSESVMGMFSVPHRLPGGSIEPKHYVGGIFTEQIGTPSNCYQKDCSDKMNPERKVQDRLIQEELFTYAVYWALKTWPNTVP